MNTTQQTENNQVAEEIFRQLNASKVNGFNFFRYTGLKPAIFSATELYLKAPRNPGKVKNILVSYDYVEDLYNVAVNGNKKFEGIFAEDLSDLIVREMGVR
jgi:hypothetical protein